MRFKTNFIEESTFNVSFFSQDQKFYPDFGENNIIINQRPPCNKPDFSVDFTKDNNKIHSNFGESTIITNINSNYENLDNIPSINGVKLIGNKTSADLDLNGSGAAFPGDGQIGDILAKTGENSVGWITPANAVEEDNTRPITAAAVYTEVGNINALLAAI